MKILVLCLLVAAATAWPNFSEDLNEGFQNDSPSGVTTAKKQQDINHLLDHVYEKTRYSDLRSAASSFQPVNDVSIYDDNGAAVQLLLSELNDHRLLEQHHWFSLFNPRHREEALLLFNVLIHCRTWTCFVNNAAYFRERINEGEFVYALYVSVIHSRLGRGIVLPPLYEITPHLFTNSEIINKAYTAKMTQTPGKFNMTFTGTKKNKEQRVAYFGEDIGMNIHHVTWHMDFPFWWKDSYGYHLDRKGELFFWAHHQLTARFDAERLSNWLDPVDELHWGDIIYEGFAPHTSYKYGGEFPARPDNVRFEDVDGVARVRDMLITESRIRDAIAHGYVVGKDGINIDIMNDHGIDVLGDIIESSIYSPNVQYYGSLHNTAHVMLGRQADPHGKFNLPPGVMEHFETATRDPSFFRLHRYMDNIFKEHKDLLPPYEKEDLEFAGVDLTNVAINGELRTYFENFEFSLKNAVDQAGNVEDVEILANVDRLNHYEFSYNIEINNNNDKDVLSTIRIYLCPQKDANGVEYTWDEGRWHCIEMDKFWKKLVPGSNRVVREATESSVTVPDLLSSQNLQTKADEAVASGSELDLHEFERSCGIPNRMLLPKGQPSGMDFVLLVAVTNGDEDITTEYPQVNEHAGTHAHCGIHGEKYPDKRPMGYPLDRRIPNKRVFLETPNVLTTNVKVFHDIHHHEGHPHDH
ncbi:hemocyanin B chain-like [Panulirus ornatus]|uniref:hemocyanin B chain-like n=1 Tax=Panulirus ornatus TaxID=150431 RepID=UPI003A8A3869